MDLLGSSYSVTAKYIEAGTCAEAGSLVEVQDTAVDHTRNLNYSIRITIDFQMVSVAHSHFRVASVADLLAAFDSCCSCRHSSSCFHYLVGSTRRRSYIQEVHSIFHVHLQNHLSWRHT